MQPSHPNCQQVLRATVLEGRGSRGAFIAGKQAFLRAPSGEDVMSFAAELLAAEGLSSPDLLKSLPDLPRGRWFVRLEQAPREDFASQTDPLLCAAILGLSGTTFYSRDRPVIWTPDRLGRAVTLYRLGNFYGN